MVDFLVLSYENVYSVTHAEHLILMK